MIIIISIYFASLFAACNEGNVFRPLVFLDWDMTLVHNPRTETGRYREAMTDAHLATLTAYFEKWNSVNFIITRGSIPTDSPIPEKFIPQTHMLSILSDQKALADQTRHLHDKEEIRRMAGPKLKAKRIVLELIRIDGTFAIPYILMSSNTMRFAFNLGPSIRRISSLSCKCRV
jgi:hypothetical protein